MEFIILSYEEAEYYHMPVWTFSEEDGSKWYGVKDDDEVKGFMEVISDDIEETINYLYVRDIYRGMGYGSFLIEKFCEELAESDKEINVRFQYSDFYGKIYAKIFSKYGFQVMVEAVDEYRISFDEVKNRFSKNNADNAKKIVTLNNAPMKKLVTFWDSEEAIENMVGYEEMMEADPERSVIAFSKDGKVTGVLLSDDNNISDLCNISALYSSENDPSLLKNMFEAATLTASSQENPPENISFLCVNKKVSGLADKLFENKIISKKYIATATFDKERYEYQKMFNMSLKGENL